MDTIGDMIIRIKNASQARKESVVIPYSKYLHAIANVLETEGFVGSVTRKGKKVKKVLEIGLKYENKKPRIVGVERLSKLSRRLYFGVADIKPVKRGFGRLVLSTPKGILTGKQAKKENVGGEALFKIW